MLHVQYYVDIKNIVSLYITHYSITKKVIKFNEIKVTNTILLVKRYYETKFMTKEKLLELNKMIKKFFASKNICILL